MKKIINITLVWILVLWVSASQSEAQNNNTVSSKAISVAEVVKELPDSIRTPNRYALVIGTGQYEDKRIPALPASLNDARQLYDILIDPSIGMFQPENVTLLVDENVTRSKVVDALDTLRRQAGSEDLVIIFFYGHGAVDELGHSYWVMHDTKIDSLRATAFSETEITDLLSEIKTTRLVTIIDACYSASTAEIGRSKSLVDLQKIYPQFKGEGRVAITGSKGDQLSVVITDKNHPGYGYSAFTWHVISGMKGEGDTDKDGVVTVNELWSYVKDRTETTARQQGGNQQPQLKGQIGSKFLLTVDSERLIANSQQIQMALEQLLQLLGDNQISANQYDEGRRLLTTRENLLDNMQRERRQVYTDLASGKLDSRYLQAALDAIETPKERQARLEREAKEKAEQERKEKFASLMSQVKANDNKENGKEALKLLEEALKLYPDNAEALALQKKITGYYGPNPGDLITNSIGMKLVWIPAGEFMMGSPSSEKDRYDDEGPQHRVKISKGFYIGIYEVTVGQYLEYLNSDRDSSGVDFSDKDCPVKKTGSRYVLSVNKFGSNESQPMVEVSWHGAQKFCDWLSRKENKIYRLPTEAEWEYACRAGAQTRFCFGDNETSLGDYAWYTNNSGSKTHQVGQKKPNGFGLYDMHGNVWEWCQDWYGSYDSGEQVDPTGPSSGSARVLRGGSWDSTPRHRRSADRNWDTPDGAFDVLGFRIVSLDF